MKQWLIASVFSVAGLLMPVAAHAQPTDEEAAEMEGRLEGYASGVRVESNSTALLWLLTGFLGVVTVAALFKNARRTHLD